MYQAGKIFVIIISIMVSLAGFGMLFDCDTIDDLILGISLNLIVQGIFIGGSYCMCVKEPKPYAIILMGNAILIGLGISLSMTFNTWIILVICVILSILYDIRVIHVNNLPEEIIEVPSAKIVELLCDTSTTKFLYVVDRDGKKIKYLISDAVFYECKTKYGVGVEFGPKKIKVKGNKFIELV